MLKLNDLRTFLAENNDPAKFNLWHTLDSLAIYLEAHITLIDNSGSILYEKANNGSHELTQQPATSTKISLSINKENDTILTIEKQELTQLDQVLLEMVLGLISLHRH